MALAQHIMCWRFGRGAMACRLCARHLCTRHRKAVVFQLLCMSCGPATWPPSCKKPWCREWLRWEAKKEQVRTAYAVLWRLGFYFNRAHALFIFSCDVEVLNVDSRTRESCGVFWKIRQGVVNLCCSDAGWARSADKTMTHKLLEFFAVTKKIGCWPMLFPGESDGLNQKLLSKSKKATPPCIMCWLVGKKVCRQVQNQHVAREQRGHNDGTATEQPGSNHFNFDFACFVQGRCHSQLKTCVGPYARFFQGSNLVFEHMILVGTFFAMKT